MKSEKQLKLFDLKPLKTQELILRLPQKAFCERILRNITNKINTLAYGPTGFGKTECATHISLVFLEKQKELGKKVLFVIHRNNLADQTVERFSRYGLKTSYIQFGKPFDKTADVFVLSIQSFSSRKEILKQLDIGLIIIDEAHNHINPRAYEFFQFFHGIDLVIIGLSATPFLEKKWDKQDKMPKYWMGDEDKPIYSEYLVDGKIRKNYYYKSFGYIYEDLVVEVVPDDLRRMGYLSECKVLTYNLFSSVGQKIDENGEYSDAELVRIFTDPDYLKHITERYLEIPLKNGRRRQGLAFCININHSQLLTQTLVNNGIRAVHVDCNTPPKKRDKILEQYCNYEIDIISSVDVVSEGFDMPQVEIGLMCRPTTSLIKLIQQIGRMLRMFEGKDGCIILDQANNTVDIKSRFLLNSDKFNPYDPLDLSVTKILGIIEPELPDEVAEKIKQEAEAKIAGQLGHEGNLVLHYSERRAIAYTNLAANNNWSKKELTQKFVNNCFYPNQASVEIINNYFGGTEKDAKDLYYCSHAYSAFLLNHGLHPEINKNLTEKQIKMIQNKAQDRQRELKIKDTWLSRQKIVPDFTPPDNNYYSQLLAARNIKPELAVDLYHTLVRKILPEAALKIEGAQERFDYLAAAYSKLLKKYPKVRSLDQKL